MFARNRGLEMLELWPAEGKRRPLAKANRHLSDEVRTLAREMRERSSRRLATHRIRSCSSAQNRSFGAPGAESNPRLSN